MKYRAQVRLVVLSVIIVCFCICSTAQLQNPPPLPGTIPSPGGTDNSVWAEQQKKELAKKANQQRQEEIRKDTEKLLELATELKQSVDRTTENTLSLDVVKKAEQIEKLAKAVKEKMKGP